MVPPTRGIAVCPIRDRRAIAAERPGRGFKVPWRAARLVRRQRDRGRESGWLSGALLLIRARESNDIRRTIQVLNRVEAPDLGVVEARVREDRAVGQ